MRHYKLVEQTLCIVLQQMVRTHGGVILRFGVLQLVGRAVIHGVGVADILLKFRLRGLVLRMIEQLDTGVVVPLGGHHLR